MNLSRAITGSLTIAEMEARKIRHDPTELFTRAIQPALWLVVFGEVFNDLKVINTSPYSYLQYIAPGVLAQSVLFVAIFYGITVVWERDVGLLTKLLSTPAPRSSMIVGKALAAGVRGLFQAVMIFILALLIGVKIVITPYSILGVSFVVVVFAMCFSSLSMLLASYLRTRDRMMGIGQAITMPLFFASNAIYPVALMPGWLQAVAVVNPLSYVVDALRALLLPGYQTNLPLAILVLLAFTVFFVSLASLVIKRMVQ